MNVYDLLGSSVYNYMTITPSYVKLDKRLNEGEFRSIIKKFLGNKGLEYKLFCDNSYILYNGESRVFECIRKKDIYFYPTIYNIDPGYKKTAQIDFAIISDKLINIFEHKTGHGSFFDEASIQVIRYMILTSYIMSKPVAGYVYLGDNGDLFRTAAIVNKNGKYYLILFRYSPLEFSEIIPLSERTIERIINSNRKYAEKIISRII